MTDPKLIEFLESHLTPERRALFNKVVNQRTKHFTVATEDVYQLHNTSAVMRSCDVFGIQNIHVIEERNLKKIDREIAMGAQKWVSLNRYHNVNDCIARLREDNYQIVATTPHGESIDLHDFPVNKPAAIFFGTEKHGLSQEVLKEADCRLKIPMAGFTESLNISVSAAIILQQLTQRMRKSDINWELTENEKNTIKFEWLRKTFKKTDELIKKFRDNR